jgi:hypothetical protein
MLTMPNSEEKDRVILVITQCCGAETIIFGSSSGSDCQKVSAPTPATLLHYFSLTRSREPEPKINDTGSSYGSGKKFRHIAAPAPAQKHWKSPSSGSHADA